jgi:hypothetical protein
MTTVGKVTSNIKIIVRRVLEIAVASRYDPAFYSTIVASRADLGFRRATATRKDYRADNIEMATKGKLDFELRRIRLCGKLRATVVKIVRTGASSPSHAL